jgi:hypothetical protein
MTGLYANLNSYNNEGKCDELKKQAEFGPSETKEWQDCQSRLTIEVVAICFQQMYTVTIFCKMNYFVYGFNILQKWMYLIF